MNLKDLLTFLKITLENNVISAVKSLKSHIYTVKLESNKVEVTNPLILPKVFEVKETNPKDYDKRLSEITSALKLYLTNLDQNIQKKLTSVEKSLKPQTNIQVDNLKDIPLTKKVEVTNPQKSVAVTNLYELKIGLGKLLKAIESLKLDPKINVPDVIVPNITVPNIKIPQTKVVIDLKKIEDLMGLLSANPKKPLAVRLSDGQKFYDAIFEAVSGGSSRSYAYQTDNGERTYGLVDGKRNVRVSQEDRWGLNNTEKSGSSTYLGQEDADGNWLITKVIKTGGSVEMIYATNLNNSTINTYTYAWSHRTTISYDRYSIAF